MVLIKNNIIWYKEIYDNYKPFWQKSSLNEGIQRIIDIEQTVSELYVSISFNTVSLIFSLITILLTFIALLSDHNHENEHTGLYNILVFATVCLTICSCTQDLFWFYLGFKSVTLPVYYLIHMYRSDIDKFKACD